MSRATDIKVAIIGAGPGGLALAQGLARLGIGFRVYERSALRDDYVQGFRLRIRDRGLNTLQDNLTPALWQAFLDTLGTAPAQTLALDDQLAPVVARSPAPDAAADDTHAEKSVSRITLRQILLSGLGDRVETGRVFARYEADADGVTLHFEDGGSLRAGILVGADGAASRVRAQLVPDATSIDTGVRRIAGKLTLADAARLGIPPLLTDNTLHIRPRPVEGQTGRALMITAHRVTPESFARHGLIGANDPSHAHLGGSHFDNTTSYVWWNTAYRSGELGSDAEIRALDGAGLIALAARRIRDWHPALQALIRHSDPSTVALLNVRSSVAGRDWAPGRVTLLGDAIHAMTYFQALGGNSALYDAGLLTRALGEVHAGRAALIPAILGYEQQMRANGYDAVRGSLSAMLATLGPLPSPPSIAAE